jgi:hypothetical protein
MVARKSAARSQKESCAEKKFKVGDRVNWDGGGKAEDKVVKVALTSGKIEGFESFGVNDTQRRRESDFRNDPSHAA